MASLLDGLMQQLGSDTIAKLGQQLGADSATTQQAVGAALPAILGALAKNAQSPDGAAALAGALEKDHDGSVLDNVSSVLGAGGLRTVRRS